MIYWFVKHSTHHNVPQKHVRWQLQMNLDRARALKFSHRLNLEMLSTAASAFPRTFCALINRHESNKIIKYAVAHNFSFRRDGINNFMQLQGGNSFHRLWEISFTRLKLRRNIYCAMAIDHHRRIVECQNELLNILRSECSRLPDIVCWCLLFCTAIRTKCVYWHDISYISLLLAHQQSMINHFFTVRQCLMRF